MDLLLFLMLVFARTLVISHCLPQDDSLSPVQLVAPKSSAEVSAETDRAAVISQALLSLLQDASDSADNNVLPLPATEKHRFSSSVQPGKNFVSPNHDARTNSAFTMDQDSSLPPETVLNNPMLPVTKKQKKVGLLTKTVDSVDDFSSWLNQLLTQAKKKNTTEGEKNKKEEKKKEGREEKQKTGMPTDKVENFSTVESWLQEAVTEAKERSEQARMKVEEVKQKLGLQKEKLDDLSRFRSWLQDAVTMLKERKEKEKVEEEEKQKTSLSAETVEGFGNFRSWLQDAVTVAKEQKEQEEKENGEEKQKINLPTDAAEGLNNIRSKLHEVLTVVKTKKEEKEKGKGKSASNTPSVGDSVMCFLCTTVMGEMKHAMDQPQMEKNMEDALENGMCPFVPEGLDCKTKVHTYCPILFQMIHQEMDPKTFCQDMTLCQDSASPQSGARALLDFLQHAAESRQVPHATPKPATDGPLQGSLLESLKPSIAAALSRTSAEAPVQNSALGSLTHAVEASEQSPEASVHRSLLDVLKPGAVSLKPTLSSPSAEVFVQNALHSLLSHLVNSKPQASSDQTDDSALSSESPVASLLQPAPDSTDLPAQPTKPFDPNAVNQLPPPSGNLLELVSTYLCRSHGMCGGGSQVEAREIVMGKQAGSGEVEKEEDTALKFLPNAQLSQDRDEARFTVGDDHDFL